MRHCGNRKGRAAADDWMDANQLSRRNLTPDAFKLLFWGGVTLNKSRVGRTLAAFTAAPDRP